MKRYYREDKVLESIFNTLNNDLVGFDPLIRDILYENIALGINRISKEPIIDCEEPPFISFPVEKVASNEN